MLQYAQRHKNNHNQPLELFNTCMTSYVVLPSEEKWNRILHVLQTLERKLPCVQCRKWLQLYIEQYPYTQCKFDPSVESYVRYLKREKTITHWYDDLKDFMADQQRFHPAQLPYIYAGEKMRND